jgi:CubicO group peptidase (beta-lactamase class C family)
LDAYGVNAILRRYLVTTPANPKHPIYAGAVALALVNGRLTLHTAAGDALRYKAGPVELPPASRVAMRPDSIFDIASITKVFTAILVHQLADQGKLDVTHPVAEYLPAFESPGKADVTIAMLLSHTGGLPVGAPLSGLSWNSVLTLPLIDTPGKTFRYSSVGLMVLGQMVEKLTGQRLDAAVTAGITRPLGLRDTGFLPLNWLSAADKANRLVATDARTSRGLLRGVVHDDVANNLGGIAGHAGLFSTAPDLAVIGQMLLDGGVYRGKRILSADAVRRMTTDVTAGLPVVDETHPNRPPDHGLGVTMNQPWFMGKLSAPDSYGHTGFTGTSLLVCPRRRLVLVLLTNRAHPNWSWADPDPPRVAVANAVADAV